jgi:hypothetical protein
MSPSPNRARLRVDTAGKWRLYSPTVPDGMQIIGTVTRGAETGALARVTATGLYVMLNAGAVKMLDQRKVASALNPKRVGGARPGAGRKATDGARGMKRVNVCLDHATIAILRAHGNGQLSAGIRCAAAGLRVSPDPLAGP